MTRSCLLGGGLASGADTLSCLLVGLVVLGWVEVLLGAVRAGLGLMHRIVFLVEKLGTVIAGKPGTGGFLPTWRTAKTGFLAATALLLASSRACFHSFSRWRRSLALSALEGVALVLLFPAKKGEETLPKGRGKSTQ